MFARDVMSKNLVTGTPDLRLYQCLELMERHGIRHLPIVENERLVGLVSDREIKFSISRHYGTGKETVEDRATLLQTAGEVMARTPFCVKPDTTARAIVLACVKHKYGAVPVIDDNDRPVGIVTTIDLLTVLLPHV